MIGALGELDSIDNDINDLWLCHFDLTIFLLLDIDSKVILDVSLVLNIQPYSLNLLYCLVYLSGVCSREYFIVYIV